MAKTTKYCKDCQCSHALGECGAEDSKSRKRPRREPKEDRMFFFDTDPLLFDP
jgi:hypothetical protein